MIDLTGDSSDEDLAGITSLARRPSRKAWRPEGGSAGTLGSYDCAGGDSDGQGPPQGLPQQRQRKRPVDVPLFGTEEELEAYLESRSLSLTAAGHTAPVAARAAAAPPPKAAAVVSCGGGSSGGGDSLKRPRAEAPARPPLSEVQPPVGATADRARGRAGGGGGLLERLGSTAGSGSGRGGSQRLEPGSRTRMQEQDPDYEHFINFSVAHREAEVEGVVTLASDSSSSGSDEEPGGEVGGAPRLPAAGRRRAEAGVRLADRGGGCAEREAAEAGLARREGSDGGGRRRAAAALDEDDDYVICGDDGANAGGYDSMEGWAAPSGSGRGAARARRAVGGVGGSEWGAGSGGVGSGGAQGGGDAENDSGAARPKRRGRKTDEERAAEAAAKRSKQEQKQREREEKAAAKISEKLAKEHQKLSDRQAAGNLYEREIVISLPQPFASGALGLAITALLQEKRWGMWRALPAGALQPLADALRECGCEGDGGGSGGVRGGRGDGGCAVITFQRRRLSPADVKSVPASTELKEPFQESAPVPCILLIFHQPAAFVAQLRAPGGPLRALLRRAAALHPGRSLQALVVGLDAHLRAQERRDFQAGTAAFVAADVHAAVLRLQLSCPALQLRKVANAEEAARHVLSLVRALGEQPYKRVDRDDALGAGGAGGSVSAAAATGMGDLGPGARKLARCLGRVQGVGGGQAWAICREFGGLGALTQGFLREQAAGRDPARLVSELRDARPSGAARRLGGAFGARLAALLTARDPEALVGREDEVGGVG